MKCLQTRKNSEPDGVSVEFYQRISLLLKLVCKIVHNQILSNLFYEYSVTLLSKLDNNTNKIILYNLLEKYRQKKYQYNFKKLYLTQLTAHGSPRLGGGANEG